jgi:hypothetical protein
MPICSMKSKSSTALPSGSSQISVRQASDPLYDARVKVLGEYIRHHVKEEESGELFPRVAGRHGHDRNRRASSEAEGPPAA